jgi:acyl carrier protein
MAKAISEIDQEYQEPSTPSEKALAKIFAKVLQLDRVGVSDNFFSLGGNSLTAARLISCVLSELGVKLPLWTLFRAATVSALAEHMDKISVLKNLNL